MNEILREDINDIIARFDEWKKFDGKTIFITGATGLIGSMLTRVFLEVKLRKNIDVKIVVQVRDYEKAQRVLGQENLEIVEQDIDKAIMYDGKIDYIVHTAAPTRSKFFVEKPVETLDAIVFGAKNILEFARGKQVEKIVMLSSMEMYGLCNDMNVTEKVQGAIDLQDTRSSYPMGKRLMEMYAYDYFVEYGVNAVSARLAMCFGAGIAEDDNRVHKAFCEAALGGDDIELKSSGETVVNFIYSADAIVAILDLLIKGESGNAYNVAGENSGFTILEMAKYIAEKNNVGVKHIGADKSFGYAPDNKMVLSSEKMRSLGWTSKYDLKSALDRLMEYLKTR